MITHLGCARRPALLNTNKLLFSKLPGQTFTVFLSQSCLEAHQRRHILDMMERRAFNVSTGRLKTPPGLIDLGFMVIWERPSCNVIYDSKQLEILSQRSRERSCDAWFVLTTRPNRFWCQSSLCSWAFVRRFNQFSATCGEKVCF